MIGARDLIEMIRTIRDGLPPKPGQYRNGDQPSKRHLDETETTAIERAQYKLNSLVGDTQRKPINPPPYRAHWGDWYETPYDLQISKTYYEADGNTIKVNCRNPDNGQWWPK